METAFEILKYTLPSLIMFVALYFVMNRFLDTEHSKQLSVLKKENISITTPLRLQAYERFVLFLERIIVDKLILRVNRPGMDAKFLKAALLKTVEEEFNHNLTQQLYVSASTYEIIKQAKDETIKIINVAGAKLPPNAKGADLAKNIFEIITSLEKQPAQFAILTLKKEIRQLF
ncbi:MAG: hypothetical protein QNK84_02990 [Flavobacteriales bacterium]|jgi:hypothetical protein